MIRITMQKKRKAGSWRFAIGMSLIAILTYSVTFFISRSTVFYSIFEYSGYNWEAFAIDYPFPWLFIFFILPIVLLIMWFFTNISFFSRATSFFKWFIASILVTLLTLHNGLIQVVLEHGLEGLLYLDVERIFFEDVRSSIVTILLIVLLIFSKRIKQAID